MASWLLEPICGPAECWLFCHNRCVRLASASPPAAAWPREYVSVGLDLSMRVLVIGGTGFIGPHIARELTRREHHVTVFHRGRTAVPPGARGIVGDRRRLTESADSLRALAPDVVIDVVLSSGRQARELMNIFRGHAGRLVAVSSMDVSRACGVTHRLEEGPLEPLPLAEETSALRSKLQTYPPAQVEVLQQI